MVAVMPAIVAVVIAVLVLVLILIGVVAEAKPGPRKMTLVIAGEGRG